MKVIGSTGSMTDMGLKHGLVGAATGDSIGRGFGMGTVSIGSTPAMCTQESGRTGRAMGMGCIPARMGADMLGSSSGESSMASDTTISGTKDIECSFLNALTPFWLLIYSHFSEAAAVICFLFELFVNMF